MRVLAYVRRYCGMAHDAGSERTLHELHKALVSRGATVDVLLSEEHPGAPSPYYFEDVFVQPYVSGHQLTQMVREYDCLVVQHGTTDRGVYLAKQTGTPLVQVLHNDTLWAAGYTAMGCDLAVYVTEQTRKVCEDDLQPMVLVPIRESEATYRMRQAWSWGSVVVHPGINPDDYAVRHHGKQYITLINLNKAKGAELFYELVKRNPQWRFLGVKGAYGNQVVQELPNLVVSDHTSDIRSVYRKTKILVMPSERESYGRVAIEGACSGIPTICSGTPGLREALGDAGIYADSVEGYEQAISDLLNPVFYAAKKKEMLYLADQRWVEYQSERDEFVDRITGLVKNRR